MGSDAEIAVFDYQKFSTEIVPAFLQLLKDGQVPGWFEDIYAEWGPEEHNWALADLKKHCTYLGDDLRCTAVPPSDLERDDWSQRACSSISCPERERCLFHRSVNPLFVEEFGLVFSHVLEKFALGQGQFLGRSVTVDIYFPFLVEHGISSGHPLHTLMCSLGTRGRVVGYGSGRAFEGVHGWLDPVETKELSKALFALPLPQFDASFEAIEKFRPVKPGPYEAKGVPFPQLSLSFVRTVAAIASAEDKGVIWSNY